MDYKTLLNPTSIGATHPTTMCNQTDHLSSTTVAGQDTSSAKRGFMASILISLFSPSGPSREWIMYFVVMGFLERIRRFLTFVWRGLLNQFWITIALDEDDHGYCESDLSLCHLVTSLTNRDPVVWMIIWLSKQPAWTRAKELSISNCYFGTRAVHVEGEADSDAKPTISFLPSFDCLASLWYRGHYVRLSRSRGNYTKEVLTIKLVIPRSYVCRRC